MFVCALAELHRTPFDLLEAESELTAGYQTEYSGLMFSLFYLSEYAGSFIISLLLVVLFGGGWNVPLGVGYFDMCIPLKLMFVVGFIFAVRMALPRIRLESVLLQSWTWFLPFSTAALPVYMWLGLIVGAIKPSEYWIFKNSKYIIRELGYDTWSRLWLGRPTEYDLRLDTAHSRFLHYEYNVNALQRISLKLNSSSLLSDNRYPDKPGL